MRWGFGWEVGPFETLRAIGVDTIVEALGDAQALGGPCAARRRRRSR